MSGDVASAKPGRMLAASEAGLLQVMGWRRSLEDLREALMTLRAEMQLYGVPENLDLPVPLLEDRFEELIDVQEHLDTKVAEVADDFIRADSGVIDIPSASSHRWWFDHLDRQVTADESQIDAGSFDPEQDRQLMVEAAEDAAADLESMLEDGASQTELEEWGETIERYGDDTTFAVTFSESIGVEGYDQAVHLVRATLEAGGEVPPEGLALVESMAGVITTALDTHLSILELPRDPANVDLPDDQRISQEFVDAFTGDYLPEDSDVPSSLAEAEFSVLVSFVDPPTDVAVELANNRLTPLVALPTNLDDAGTMQWGDHQGEITNYATMLSRNPTASTRWLHTETGDGYRTIDVVMQRDINNDFDGGVALSTVVEHGLTHPLASWRRELLDHAIDAVARQEAIYGQEMYGALATAVESNMDLIHDRTNELTESGDWDDSPTVLATHDFMRELSSDGEAADRVRGALAEFSRRFASELPGDEEHQEERFYSLMELGRTQGLVAEAEVNAIIGEGLDEMTSREQLADKVNLLTGLSTAGTLNDVLDQLGRTSVGDGVERLLRIHYDDDLDAAGARVRGRLAEAELDTTLALAAAVHDSSTEAGAQMRRMTVGASFLNADGQILDVDHMTDEQRHAFTEWALSEQVVGNEGERRFGSITEDTSRLRSGQDQAQDSSLRMRTHD